MRLLAASRCLHRRNLTYPGSFWLVSGRNPLFQSSRLGTWYLLMMVMMMMIDHDDDDEAEAEIEAG